MGDKGAGDRARSPSERRISRKRSDDDVLAWEVYQVVVDCASEDEQRVVYERLREEGRRCRLFVL